MSKSAEESKVISIYSPEVVSAVHAVSVSPSATAEAEDAAELALTDASAIRFCASVTSRSFVKTSSGRVTPFLAGVAVPSSHAASSRAHAEARTSTATIRAIAFFFLIISPFCVFQNKRTETPVDFCPKNNITKFFCVVNKESS